MNKQAYGNHLYEKHAHVKATFHIVGISVCGKILIGKTKFYEVIKTVGESIADNYNHSKG